MTRSKKTGAPRPTTLAAVAIFILALGLASGAWLATASVAESSANDGSAENSHAQNSHAQNGHARAEPNRLADESSPYLLLHQYNPVDWYPWGQEALEKARREDKPIFLSVGYSTCYWCHVMERESFSDAEIATYMNEHFVNIKVDREERPDLDEIYMLATRLLSRGRGGWPNSVFLTPSLEPFFAGTYFPSDDRGGRPGFATLLRGIHRGFTEQRSEVHKQAAHVAERMRLILGGGLGDEKGSEGDAARAAYNELEGRFDPEYGGFSRAPKFPTPSNLFLLLHSGESRAQEMLAFTLDRMARGGVYDQVGGGFHRYATDRAWRVPHFEKMLYDNGSLLEIYALSHERRGDAQSKRILEQTAAFLAREMTAPGGAFFSAIDAETDAREGAFYVWRREELDAALGKEDHAFAAPILGFDGEPSFRDPHAAEEPATFILHLPKSLQERARGAGLNVAETASRLDAIRGRLLEVRAERKRPLTDDKILTDWNGLAIAGLAEAGRVLDHDGLIRQAERAAAFVLRNLKPDGQPLQHVWRSGIARIDAFLADYSYFIHGLLALYEATGSRRWLEAAEVLADEQIRRLWDEEGGGFFVAAPDPELLSRSKDPSDGARPSANGMALLNLTRLHRLTGEERWAILAARMTSSFRSPVAQSPSGHTTLARAIDAFETSAKGLSLDDQARSKLSVRGSRRNDEIDVMLEIAEGWHVNANPASDEFLVPTRLSSPQAELKVDYPAGQAFKAAFAQEPIQVYGGRVVLRARPQGSVETLVLEAQPCDDERCLPTVKITFGLEAGQGTSREPGSTP